MDYAALVEGVCGSDADAFRMLVETYRRSLYLWLLAHVVPHQSHGDRLQDLWLKVRAALHDGTMPSAEDMRYIGAYLKTTLARAHVDGLRKKKRKKNGGGRKQEGSAVLAAACDRRQMSPSRLA